MNSGNKAAKAAIMIIILTFGSKVLGFFREVLIAAKFGSGYDTDTYIVALTAIGLVAGLVGVTITTALIPILTEIGAKNDRKAKIKYTNNVINTVLIISVGIYLIGLYLSPSIVNLVAKEFAGEQLDFAIKLTRIGLPIVVITGLNSVLTGYLHSEQRFFSSALGGFGFNIILILFLMFFSKIYGIEGLMFASIIAYISRIIIQLPDLFHSGLKYRFFIDFKDKYLYRTAALTIPIYFGTVMDEINLILDKTFASGLQTGSISALNYANKLNGLVLGVFISAVSTVVFPMLSKEFSKDNYDEIKKIMNYGINLILLVTIPSVVGLIVLSEPIVTIAFQRGEFDTIATSMTSKALIYYSLGLISMGIGSIITKVYYSLQDTKTPTVSVAVSLSLNIILNMILVKTMGHSGLALATSIATTAATLFMIYRLRKKMRHIGIKSYIECGLKSGIASVIMGVVAHVVYHGLYRVFSGRAIYNILSLLIAVVMGVAVYVIFCYVFKVGEVRKLIGKLKDRIVGLVQSRI